jgi:ribosomal protein L37AE/L43A
MDEIEFEGGLILKCPTCLKEMEYSERYSLWYCEDCTIRRWEKIYEEEK